MTTPALEVRTVSYRAPRPDGNELRILDAISLSIAPGEHLSIVGRSGSGKTTLLSVMGLLATPHSGSVYIRGDDVTHASDRRRAGLRLQHIGFVFQAYSLLPHLDVYANVSLPLRNGPLVTRGDERREVSRALEAVGLGAMSRHYPRALSGGEQQRVAIARALVRHPALILADEPTGALDVETGDNVLREMRMATQSHDAGLVVVTHDHDVAAAGTRVVRMDTGRLVEAATR